MIKISNLEFRIIRLNMFVFVIRYIYSYIYEYIRVQDSGSLRVESLFRFSIAIDVS